MKLHHWVLIAWLFVIVSITGILNLYEIHSLKQRVKELDGNVRLLEECLVKVSNHEKVFAEAILALQTNVFEIK